MKQMREAGKSEQFDALKVYLAADATAPPHAEVAKKLGSTEGAVKVAVHRLRQRYKALLRAEIAKTVEDEADIDDEIQGLIAALG